MGLPWHSKGLFGPKVAPSIKLAEEKNIAVSVARLKAQMQLDSLDYSKFTVNVDTNFGGNYMLQGYTKQTMNIGGQK